METSYQTIKRHPIRGGAYGLLLGLGVAIYLVIFSVVRFGEWVMLGLAVVVCIGIGVAWAYLAPAKKPKASPAAVDYTADQYPQAQQPYPEQAQQAYPDQAQQGYPEQAQQPYPEQAQQPYPDQPQQPYPDQPQ